MFGQRPQFGGTSAFGGFGTTNTQSGFGTGFTRPAFGVGTQSSGFGSTAFGSSTSGTGSSLFGSQNQQSTGGLFGSQTSTGFGTGTNFGSGTGGSLFGTQSATTQPSSGGLFGNTSSFNAQQQNHTFGFGTPTTSSVGGCLFGSSTAGTGGSLFRSSTGTSFGSPGPIAGTPVKYNPVTGTDTLNKNGVSHNVQTRIEVISCMKDYENKSLEELRAEDYLAGRKTGSTFGGQSTGLFGSNAGTGLFGQKPPETKPLFGSTSTSFGTSNLFGNSASAPAFGQTSTAPSSGFTFGQNTQNKGTGFSFGSTTSAPSLFRQTSTPSSGFGSSTGFSFGQTSQSSPFGQNKSVFGTSTTSGSGGLFGSKPASTSAFGTGFGTGFGTSTSSAFGTPNTGTGLFGNTNQQKPGFSFGGGTGFGTTTSGFGSGGGLFNTSKPGGFSFGSGGGFGSSNTGFFNTGTSTSGGFLGGFNTSANPQGTTFGFNMQPNANVPGTNTPNNNIDVSNLIKALTHNYFGNSSLLKNAVPVTGKADELLNSPPEESERNKLNPTSRKPTYVLPSLSSNKPQPVALTKNGPVSNTSTRKLIFAGLDDSTDNVEDPFKPKSYPSVKKLDLKIFKSSPISSQDISEVSTQVDGPGPVSLTNPVTSSNSGTPRPSLPNSHENTPTPELVPGKKKMKRVLANKNMNDTLLELNVVHPYGSKKSVASPEVDSPPEANKENQDISVFDSSAVEEETDFSPLNTSKPHPAGIKLARNGYYTLPSLDDLAEMLDSDGKCLVENFTIGRMGYGNVCFPGVTDAFGLDLDSIVFIVRKEIEIYPEGVEKPPEGDGLNKSAIVTLDCVWPIDKTSREVIKCQERLDSMNWVGYLENQCVKMNATFVEYRPETGSWVFKVKHFSKYGLQDAAEDNEVPAGTVAVTENRSVSHSSKTPQLSEGDAEQNLQFSGSHSMSLQSSLLQSGGKVVPQDTPVALTATPMQHLAPPVDMEEAALGSALSGKEGFLNGSGFQSTFLEDCDMTTSAREPEESAEVFSPSCERHALTSRAPFRTVQKIKSHLFSDEVEPDTDTSLSSYESCAISKDHRKKLLLMTDDSSPLMSTHDLYTKKDGAVSSQLHQRIVELYNDVSSEYEPVPHPSLRELRTSFPAVLCKEDCSKEQEPFLSSHLGVVVPLSESLVDGKEVNLQDSAAFHGRSFRVCWGPGWTVIHPGFLLSSLTSRATDREQSYFLFGPEEIGVQLTKHSVRTKLLVGKLHLIEHDPEISDAVITECFEEVLKCSVHAVESVSDPLRKECPVYRPSVDLQLLHALASTAFRFKDTNPHMNEIFSLCVALWGKLEFHQNGTDPHSYDEAHSRLEALSQWLEGVNDSEAEASGDPDLNVHNDEQEESYLEAILTYLTMRQISKACIVAQDKGDHHLALLIAQSCLGQEFPRQVLDRQLIHWTENQLDGFVTKTRLAIYALLSGKVTHMASSGLINPFLGMTWRRALALHLWYICPATSTITEVLKEYEKAAGITNSEESYCSKPYPFYIDKVVLSERKVSYDVCYHLLKLYTDSTTQLEQILDPSTNTCDPLDVTVSWLLWSVLGSLGYHHLSDSQTASLHLSMAALLESLDLWHLAVFVLLHLLDSHRRVSEVTEVLRRHVQLESDEEGLAREEFITEKLLLPSSWIHEAKAVKARCLNRRHEEAWHLLQAGDYNKAHVIIVSDIAPNAIINEDHLYLQKYLNEMDDKSINSQVMSWSTGGAVYVDYLQVLAMVEDMKTSGQPTMAKLERLRPRLLALCSTLNNLKCPTAVHRLCISEMSRVVVGVLRAVVGEGIGATQMVAQQITALPMTHDYALEELNQLTTEYLTQVTEM